MLSSVSNHIQSLLSWVLATIVVTVCAIGFFLFHRGDEELRRSLQQHLQASLPGKAISIESASFVKGEGVLLRDISIMQPASQSGVRREELMFCESATIRCSPTIEKLVQGRVDIEKVVLRNLLLRAIRNPDGTWNLSDLCQSDKKMKTPTIELRNSRIELIDQSEGVSTVLHISRGTIEPSDETSDRLVFNASATNDQVKSLEARGWIDPATHQFAASGEVIGLTCDRTLLQLAPRSARQKANILSGFRATANLSFSVAKAAQETTPRFHVLANLWNGRFDDPTLLPESITDISAAEVEIKSNREENSWNIGRLAAKYDGASIDVRVEGESLAWDGDIVATGACHNLNLTTDLVAKLPPRIQELWQKYQALGRIDVNWFQSEKRNGKWRNTANAQCKDVSIVCSYFPYQIFHAAGDIQFKQDEKLLLNLVASTEANSQVRPIKIVADVDNPGKRFTGLIKVDSQSSWLPLDRRLRDAVRPGARKILEDMQARGEVRFAGAFTRQSPDQKLAKNIQIQFRNGSVQYKSFPYPIRDVGGLVHVEEHQWRFTNFVGGNDSCRITAEGNWLPYHRGNDGQTRPLLNLEFIAQDVPCDAELREALPAGPQRLWQSMRPSGHVDHATITLVHQQGMRKPERDGVITQRKRRDDEQQQSLEIQPSWFPLRMGRVTGVVNYRGRDGTFVLEDISAEYGSPQQSAKFSTKGQGIFREDGSWEVQLTPMRADNVPTSREFVTALPNELAKALRWLQFQGNIWIDGEMKFAGNSEPNSPVDATWDTTINIDNASLRVAGHNIQSLFGQVKVIGNRLHNITSNSGFARFGSLLCDGIQLEKVSVPWLMDRNRLIFGAGATGNSERPSHLVASVFGGFLQADGAIGLQDNIPFQISIPYAVFDAAELANDMKWRTNITGRGEARLELNGTAEGLHTLGGQGSVRLRDANLAKLPAIIELVNKMRLRNTRPDVFTSGDIDFELLGRDLKVQRFDLHGESLTMKGRGWLSLDRQVDLEFHTILGNEHRWLPAMRPWIGQASQQFLLIRASGTTDNITLEREVLPALNDYLFPDSEQRPEIISRRP